MTDIHRSDLPLQHVNVMYSSFTPEGLIDLIAQDKRPRSAMALWVHTASGESETASGNTVKK